MRRQKRPPSIRVSVNLDFDAIQMLEEMARDKGISRSGIANELILQSEGKIKIEEEDAKKYYPFRG